MYNSPGIRCDIRHLQLIPNSNSVGITWHLACGVHSGSQIMHPKEREVYFSSLLRHLSRAFLRIRILLPCRGGRPCLCTCLDDSFKMLYFPGISLILRDWSWSGETLKMLYFQGESLILGIGLGQVKPLLLASATTHHCDCCCHCHRPDLDSATTTTTEGPFRERNSADILSKIWDFGMHHETVFGFSGPKQKSSDAISKCVCMVLLSAKRRAYSCQSIAMLFIKSLGVRGRVEIIELGGQATPIYNFVVLQSYWVSIIWVYWFRSHGFPTQACTTIELISR